jgi:diguanylate cyclase (GGDEF)-like protein
MHLLLSDPWNNLAALALSLALLWVAADLGDQSHASGERLAQRARWLATLIGAAAIWWPAHQGQARLSDNWSMPTLLLFGTAVITAHGARLGARLPWHHRENLLGLGITLLGACASVSLMHMAQGEGLHWSAGMLLLAAMLLAVTLRGLHAPMRQGVPGRTLRALAALLGAALLMALGLRNSPTSGTPDPILLPMGMLVVMGGVLATTLRQLRRHRSEAQGPDSRLVLLDALTGLPNRLALDARLAKAAQQCDAERGGLALMVLNLDGFKSVNATFGHTVGDQLLKRTAQRLTQVVGDKDVLARAGADEFVLMLTGSDSREALDRLAERVIQAVSRPLRVGTRVIELTGSLGTALYPDHGSADMLIARAEMARKASKRSGGARATHYSSDLDDDLAQDFELLRDFRQALEQGGLELAYQPKIDARSGQITAAEALLRWRHPVRGDVSPAIFVALAERFGLIARLGDWVIDSACRQARIWVDHGLSMRVAINLSAQHLREPELPARIRAAIEQHRIDPSRLTCEITESLAMENTAATQSTMAQLGEIGVHLSIDDFGTGYSSLSYLRRLPAREIKIDRSFVMDLERSTDARAVVDAVVRLAHALGKRVVAEGVETIRQRQILTELDCDELQGYLFARPMAGADLLQWALDARNDGEKAFRASLYVPSAEAEARHRRETVTPLRVV